LVVKVGLRVRGQVLLTGHSLVLKLINVLSQRGQLSVSHAKLEAR